MSKRQKTWWLVASALLLLLLSLNFLSFRAAWSTTDTKHSLSTYRMGETLPASVPPGFTLSYAVTGEERLAAALATALQAQLEAQTSVGTATAVPALPQNGGAPFLLVDLSSDRLWTPFYGRATLNAQIYYAYDGDAPWPLDEPVVIQVSPAVKADGEFVLVDTTWGLISKPAYTGHLAQALAEAIAAALQQDVFRISYVHTTMPVTVTPTAPPAGEMMSFEVPETGSVAPQPLAPTADMDPVAVTQAFYDWYLAYVGDQDSGQVHNPLTDRAYYDNPLLTPEFVSRIDEIVAGSDRGDYDPFLLAQDVSSIHIPDAPAVVGPQVRVAAHRYIRGSLPGAIFVYLAPRDGVWLINDVTTTELYAPTTETPEGTVQIFYRWWIDAVLRQFEDDAARADYHNSDLLTTDYKQYLDDLRAEAEARDPEMGLHYDPILCAQDVPTFVVPDQAFIAGETALVTVRTSFQKQVLLLDLRLEGDDGWMISNITCVHSPESTVRAFYAWYLGYIGDRGDGNFRNPLADRAYRWHPLLSPAFVQQVEEMRDEEGGFGHDPFLAAQEVPTNFSVVPGVEEGTVVVHLQFGPEYVHHVLVTTVESHHRQAITAIEPADPWPTEAP